MSRLEDYYFGNEIPYDAFYSPLDPEFKQVSEQAVDLENKLCDTLTDAQKELLNALMTSKQTMSTMEVNRMFLYSFKLAFNLAIEIIT